MARDGITEGFRAEQEAAIAGGRFFEVASDEPIRDGADLTAFLREVADEAGPMMGARRMRKVRVLITYDKEG